MAIPSEIHEQKYISLATFRKNGTAVNTPVWFAEADGKLYVKTRNDSGKYKRIRNSGLVKVAPCTMNGKITGPVFTGNARIMPAAEWKPAETAMKRKYWLTRLPFWSTKNEYLEIQITA
jgi:PPOX class probable F420-dependent enzyme